MTFIRQRRRDPETGELSPRDLVWCCLSEILLTFLYVDAGAPGQCWDNLKRLLVIRAQGITRLSESDNDFPMVECIAEVALEEVSRPKFCKECSGAGQVPEWRWLQHMHEVEDWTRVRPEDCPVYGGHGLKQFSAHRRCGLLRVGHETYEALGSGLREAPRGLPPGDGRGPGGDLRGVVLTGGAPSRCYTSHKHSDQGGPLCAH